MICAYIDDAGNTGINLNDLKQPLHFVGAILFGDDKWASLRDDLKFIADTLPSHGGEAVEFHGVEIVQGNGPWDDLKYQERLYVYRQCIDLMHRHQVRVVYGCCDKIQMRRYKSPMHPHQIALWLCLEKIAEYVNGLATCEKDLVGYVVADETSKDIKGVARRVLDDYRAKGPPFGRPMDISRLIDVVHMMSSKASPHLQLCDLAMYALRREAVVNDNLGGIADSVRQLVWASRVFPYKKKASASGF